MDKRLLVICAITGLILSAISFPEGASSVLIVLAVIVPAVILLKKSPNSKFLINVLLIALLARMWLGIVIHWFTLMDILGPDAYTYNNLGYRMYEIWQGIPVPDDNRTYRATNPDEIAWGMIRIVAVIYTIFGQSMLVAQSFCAAIGALTAPMVYFCADRIFNNSRVSRISALSVALFPSLVIWSSQLLKEGLIIFLLVCAITLVLQLQKKLNYLHVALLVLSVFGVYVLRFYIFYMVAITVVGSFFIGSSASGKIIARNIIIVIALGVSLTYLGITQSATTQLETFGNLEKVQLSRQDLSTSAGSGFGEEYDVSTPVGALSAIPIGLLYLMFAPFPWQVEKFSQVIILPETFVWWALTPLLISGLWYTMKNRLRNAVPVLLFTLMLTISYAIFQGNVGMIYRQRTQIQVFLFMFIAVGFTLLQERRENRKIIEENRRRKSRVKVQTSQIDA